MPKPMPDAMIDALYQREGYEAGRNEAGLPQYKIDCPYDGRTKAGRAWWKGFMQGDRERREAARKETTR